jgi:RNA polymerase sigma-70 factor (ECF subfamily)
MTIDPTRASLLVRLRDPGDRAAWETFVRIYSPMVFRFALRSGLQEADAADVTQDVLQSVHRGADRFVYDPEKGTFRGWLKTVARTRIADHVARRRRQPIGAGGTEMSLRLSEHADRHPDDQWEADYRQSLFEAAIEKIRGEFRESTFEAFWRCAVRGEEAAAVARDLGMSIGAVYIAKSRVTARLRDVIAVWERESE